MHRPTLIKCSPRNVKIVPTPLELTPKGRCEGHVTHVNFTFGPPSYIFKTHFKFGLQIECHKRD